MRTVWLLATALPAVLVLALWAFYVKLRNALTGNLGHRLTQPTKGQAGDPIVLNSFFVPMGKLVASVSPFTAKIEAFLRFNGIRYTEKNSDFATSPNGRLPWLKHGKDAVSDSRFIVKYLFNTYPSLQKQEPTSTEGAARALLIQRLCEQHMYFTFLYHSVVPEKAKKNSVQFFSNLPFPLNHLAALAWRQGRATQLRYQGVLVNSETDINQLMSDDDAALSGLLGTSKYFFGDKPTVTDATVFAFLHTRLYTADPSSHNALSVRRHDNLVAFVEHIRQEFFADKLAKLAKKEGKTA